MIEPVTKAKWLIAPAIERWEANVDRSDECWIYNCAPTAKGYRRFRDDTGRTVYVHRFAYEHFRGPIPKGLTLDHLCRNRACCNPDHLEPVTAAENTRRGKAGEWKAARTHCPQGHEYSEENTYTYQGKRQCRECRRQKIRERDAKRRSGNG